LDAELLRRLMVKLGVEEQKSQTILAEAATTKRAEVVKESDGSARLLVNDPFDRAWRRVGLALDRIGFVIEDRDRSNGLFFVRYADVDIDDTPKKKKGLFETLKFWGDDD
jgi:outer membrane protein assembly factor BamC